MFENNNIKKKIRLFNVKFLVQTGKNFWVDCEWPDFWYKLGNPVQRKSFCTTTIVVIMIVAIDYMYKKTNKSSILLSRENKILENIIFFIYYFHLEKKKRGVVMFMVNEKTWDLTSKHYTYKYI